MSADETKLYVAAAAAIFEVEIATGIRKHLAGIYWYVGWSIAKGEDWAWPTRVGTLVADKISFLCASDHENGMEAIFRSVRNIVLSSDGAYLYVGVSEHVLR